MKLNPDSFKSKFGELKKITLLAAAILSAKASLFIIAYFFDAQTYNNFNQAYYTSSILILFGGLGFNIAVTRIKISLRLVIIAVIINLLFTYTVLFIISGAFSNPSYIISVLIYSCFSILGGIFTFRLLFAGYYKEYVYLTIIYSILHLLIIPFVIIGKVDVILTLPFVTTIWFILGYPKFIRKSDHSSKILKEFYKIGISAFIINSAVSLALSFDKYYVNSFFSLEIANSYTFAWALTAPVFYIGSLIEKYLYSGATDNLKIFFRKGFILSLIFILSYMILVTVVIRIFPQLLPGSVDENLVQNIELFMLAGYSVYCILHFTFNAYLFKVMQSSVQKEISMYFAIIILIFLAYFINVLIGNITLNYTTLLVSVWVYIFSLLIVKITILIIRRSNIILSENISPTDNYTLE